MKRIFFGLVYAVGGYLLGGVLGYLLVVTLSTNTHDRRAHCGTFTRTDRRRRGCRATWAGSDVAAVEVIGEDVRLVWLPLTIRIGSKVPDGVISPVPLGNCNILLKHPAAEFRR